MKMRIVYGLLLIILISTSCNKYNHTVTGGAIGAGLGGALGGLVGKKHGSTVVGVLVGAAVGGAAGAAIGRYMDKQAEEIQKDLKGAKVERVGEGIKITFPAGILFDVNSTELKGAAKKDIEDLSKTLQKYKDTNILVEGHTDNTGTDQYNQQLSEKRAETVSNFAKSLGVEGSRFSTMGYGESQPVADNSSVEGRHENRRVEIAIYANDKLKKAAKKGQL
jgi:outer membrane protein OmpA-like peptidoglycan-associated protein